MRKIFLWCIFLILSITSVWANSEIEKIYNRFLQKIEVKYPSVSHQNDILQLLSKKIPEVSYSSKDPNKRKKLSTLLDYNNEEIFKRFIRDELSLEDQKELEAEQSKIQNFRKKTYSDLAADAAWLVTDNWKIYEKNGSYVSVNYSGSLFFDDVYGVSYQSLQNADINVENDFVYKKEWGDFHFIINHTQKDLVKVSDVFGLSNKAEVLSQLWDDAKHKNSNIPQTFQDIKKKTQELTQWLAEEEKVAAIYKWILEHMEYSKVVDFTNTQIFSGIEGFNTGDGVCTSYSRLFAYMLSFADIIDVEVIEWYVIDAQDFPQVGHAWVRIGEKYYDPTFDDPVWFWRNKTADEYLYYGLPKDIFYTNRYEQDMLPKALKLASDEEITKHIHDRLRRLIPKYSAELSMYPVFAPVTFRENYNISPLIKITPQILSATIGDYKVDGENFSFTKKWKKEYITSLRYFILNDSNTEDILKQIHYKLDDYYLFEWNENGKKESRLAYDVILR